MLHLYYRINQELDVPNMYDDIMRILHEAGVFAELEEQQKLARVTRHTHQIAETEILYGSKRKQVPLPS